MKAHKGWKEQYSEGDLVRVKNELAYRGVRYTLGNVANPVPRVNSFGKILRISACISSVASWQVEDEEGRIWWARPHQIELAFKL